MSEWQPIETADRPDEGAQSVLLLQEGRRFVGEWDGAAGQWQAHYALDGVERDRYFQEMPGRLYGVTHWQPVPYDIGVHLSHCDQGEYEGGCKYGEDETCPALKMPLPAPPQA